MYKIIDRLEKRKTFDVIALKNIEIKDPFWYVNKGGKVGGLGVYKKYRRIGGNPEYARRSGMNGGKKREIQKAPIINVCLPIDKPQKSPELAEFIGILWGWWYYKKTSNDKA